MSKERISGIYTIRRLGTLDFYVGSSVDVHRRWSKHKHKLNKGNHHSPYLQHAWNCYSELLFEFEILEIVPSHLIMNGKSLMPFEQRWIDLIEPCYNVCPAAGSCLGYKHTPEARAKIVAALKGRIVTPETKAKISAAHKGQTHTPETKAKISMIRIGNKNWQGKKHTSETKAKLSAALKGKIISPEHRAKLSAALKGKKQTPEHRSNSVAGRAKALAVKQLDRMTKNLTVP